MAEKSEIEKLLETVVKKVDGLADDVRTNSFKLDRLEQKVANVDEKVDHLSSDLHTLSRQFNDVGIMAIKDSRRIDDVSDLETSIH